MRDRAQGSSIPVRLAPDVPGDCPIERRQFAAVAAAARTRVDVGLRFTDAPASKLLTPANPPGQATHRLSLTSVDEVTGRSNVCCGRRTIRTVEPRRWTQCRARGILRGRSEFRDRMTMAEPRPNHRLYLQVLRRMSPEQRLRKAFELAETGRELFRQGLRRRYPELTADELQALVRKRLDLCHNKTY